MVSKSIKKNKMDNYELNRLIKKIQSEGGSSIYSDNPFEDFMKKTKKEKHYSTNDTTLRGKKRYRYDNEVDDFLEGFQIPKSNTWRNENPNKKDNSDFNWDKDKEREKETQAFFDYHTKKFNEFLEKQFE